MPNIPQTQAGQGDFQRWQCSEGEGQGFNRETQSLLHLGIKAQMKSYAGIPEQDVMKMAFYISGIFCLKPRTSANQKENFPRSF